MRIIDKIKADGVHISFEVFPPKTDAGFESVLKATDGIAELTPSFISVTYGAGGGTSKNTVKIASHIKNDLKIPALAHLTCVSSTKEEVHKVIGQLQKEGIENILALRGDIPQDGQFPLPGQYSHACELIEDIKKMGDFCIGAACYPEGHVEMEHKKDDIRYLKEKVDCGVDFITTQMFFNNDIFYNFLYRIREQGIMIPVLPGIMPITTKKQLARSCALSGTAVPQNMDSTPGAKLHGVSQSTYFLHNVSSYNEGAIGRNMVPLKRGDKVGIVGCGNVAMDAARTAIRLGADVTILYRRTQEEMPAINSEYEDALKEGVKFEWETSVEEFIEGKKGRLAECRLKTPDGEHIEKFDRIYLAIGSRPANRIVSTTGGIEVDEKGYVKVVERPCGMTTRRGVFAGGDVVHRPQTVVLAMKAAKNVAQGIAEYVDAMKLLEVAKKVEEDHNADK